MDLFPLPRLHFFIVPSITLLLVFTVRLFPSPLFIACLQVPSMLGIYYLMFATFAGKLPSSLRKAKKNLPNSNHSTKDVFSTTYGFKTGPGGLAYIGLGIGFISATFFGAKTANDIYKYVSSFPQLSPHLILILALMIYFPFYLDDNRIMAWAANKAGGQEWRERQA